jgi:hypothetical protein
MKLHFTSILGVLLLLVVLPLYPFTTQEVPPTIDAASNATVFPVRVPGTGSFNEDFTTTTYRDGGATTVSGWGGFASGTLTNTRDYTVAYLDGVPTGGICYDVDVQGRTLFASVSNPAPAADMQIYDISNPAAITLLSVRTGWSWQSVIEVAGDWAMMSSLQPGSGVGFYNVTTLTQPIIGGAVGAITGNATDMEIQGHFCYFAVNNSMIGQGFQIIDIENPVAPFLIPPTYPSSTCQGLAIDGQIAYLAEGPFGITLLNISNPYAITPIASLPLPAVMTMDILVEGDIAYVAAGQDGIFVVDCSGPPAIIGHCDTPGIARRLVLQSNTLVVADDYAGVEFIDVADPTHPSWFYGFLPAAPAYDVTLYAGDIVVGTAGTIETWRVAGDPLGVSGLQSMSTWSLPWNHTDIRVKGDIGYVAAGPDGFHTCDLRHSHSFGFMDDYPDPGRFYRKLDVQGNYAYVADYGAGGGVRVFNVADPYNIQLVDTYALTSATDVFVHGEVVFVCNGNNIEILDASSPYSLSYITSIIGFSNATSCWVQGNTLYVTSDFAWWFYDISTIAAPTLITGWTMTTPIHYDWYIDGDVSYLGDLTGNVYILNVTDPNTPGLSSIVGSPTYQCWGFGPYMVTANGTAGVGLVNTTNILAGIPMQGLAPPLASMESVVVSGDYVYACGDTILLISRIFEGAASNFFTGTYTATSLEVDSTDQQIENATLTVDSWVPLGISIGYELSADGGLHWETVTPGVEHYFMYPGNDLRFRANLTSGYTDISPHLYEITINYEYNDVPSTPSLTDPGTTDDDGTFTVTWSASTDDGYIHHYVLQMSDSAAFSIILDSWTPTGTSHPLTGLSNGTYYYRVRAVDDDSVSSPWSNTESIVVAIPPPTTPPPPIPGFPVVAIAIGVVIGLGGSIILRRRKHSK